MINSHLLYPEPGSNRHRLPYWCLRPARLPIPPSGLFCCEKQCKSRQFMFFPQIIPSLFIPVSGKSKHFRGSKRGIAGKLQLVELRKDTVGNRLHFFIGEVQLLSAEVHIPFALHWNKVDMRMGHFESEHRLPHFHAGKSVP